MSAALKRPDLCTGLQILRRWLRDHYGLRSKAIERLRVTPTDNRGPTADLYARKWKFRVPFWLTDGTTASDPGNGVLKLLREPWGDTWWHIEGLY